MVKDSNNDGKLLFSAKSSALFQYDMEHCVLFILMSSADDEDSFPKLWKNTHIQECSKS
jgi:hypothetical protein